MARLNAKTIMSALLNVSIRVDALPKEKFVAGKDGKVYYNFTIAINDEANQFGQNVSLTDSQTKEEREAKKAKNYIGNGNVVWTDGNIVVVKKASVEVADPYRWLEDDRSAETVSSDLPF